MRSDRTLKKWYSVINKKFFFGELPANVIVRWALPGEEKDTACCTEYEKERYCFDICLNRAKNPTNAQKLSTLVHEMIHVATRCSDNHGPMFDEWHKKLTERGAFKKGALLKGVCLF